MKKRELLHQINNARQMLINAVQMIESDESYENILSQIERAEDLCYEANNRISDEIGLTGLAKINRDLEKAEKLMGFDKTKIGEA